LAQVEIEKEKPMKDLTDIRDEVLALEQMVSELQRKIDTHVCVIRCVRTPRTPLNAS